VEAESSDVARKVLLIDSADNKVNAIDWRTPIINYLRNPSVRTDRNARLITFKYVLMSDELYRRMVNDVRLKCLGPGDAVLATAEIHEAICGTHLSHQVLEGKPNANHVRAKINN
jgi:hypothetical protein